MSILIEAVPNFSEGRRPKIVAAIVAAIQAPGVLLLDASSDADHNRSVVTVAGAPEAVLEGLFRATAVAAEHIDLFTHCGEHPRIGATDVIPLVPIADITLNECAVLAQQARNYSSRSISTLRLPRALNGSGCPISAAASSKP